mmetsp:Transcript_5291/g.6673  ORF Transcript_5291/g.6673 Transcript_5291/m.6673 type:complete len:313 (-) Transcript_5291:244-1182(-)
MDPDGFEWILAFDGLKQFFQPEFLKHNYNAKLLVLGCGDSKLSEELYKAGYSNIVNLDNKKEVIDRMKKSCSFMTWVHGDALDCPELEDRSFDILVDKSLFDYLLAENYRMIGNYLSEVQRLTASGGIFILISFHPHNYLRRLLTNDFLCFDTFETFPIELDKTKKDTVTGSVGTVLVCRNEKHSNERKNTNDKASEESFLLRISETIDFHFQKEKPMFSKDSIQFCELRSMFVESVKQQQKISEVVEPPLPYETVYSLIIPPTLQAEYSFQYFLSDVEETISQWKQNTSDNNKDVSGMTFAEACLFLEINQ